ncbi:MAG: ABC transporter permease [Armatimonadota bacterium]|nr:ABC transporter permease [Armatimonadota bacterium]
MGKPDIGVRNLLVKLLSYGILVFFVLLCLYFDYVTRGLFLSGSNIVNILQQTAINTIIAVGMTFVIISGGIDLSVGSILSLAGVLSTMSLLQVFSRMHQGPAVTAWPLVVAVLVAGMVSMAVGAAAGAFNGFCITRLRVTPFIATLAMMGSARGLSMVFTDAVPISPLPTAFTNVVGGPSILRAIPPLVPLAILVFVVGYVVLTQTDFGRRVYAIGGNQEAARLSGVNVAHTKLGVYTIAGLLAGLSGLMFAARVGAGDPKSGQMFEMDAIAAVVLGGTSLMGGTGSVAGTLLGSLVIGVLAVGLDITDVSTYWQMVIKGGVILLAVVLDQLKVRLGSVGL